jgi:acetyltransferase-like isoleucine patch superfamily enzyme
LLCRPDTEIVMSGSSKVYKEVMHRFPGTVLEDNVIIKGNIDGLKLGENVIIQSGSVLHLGGMDWCLNAGSIEIGDGGVISPNCVLYGCGPGGLKIGSNFDCGPGVVIVASRTDYTKGKGNHIFSPVVIGNDVTVFSNAVIDPGVTIGSGAVVAACSVVTSDVPDNTLVGGAPSRIIRALSRD